MIDNDLQLGLLSEDEGNPLHYESPDKSSPSHFRRAKSFNDFALSFFCSLTLEHKRSLMIRPETYVEFTDIKETDLTNYWHRVGFAIYECMRYFIENPEAGMRDISTMYQNKIAKIGKYKRGVNGISGEEFTKKTADLYISMMKCLSNLADSWQDFHSVIIMEQTYRTYGRRARMVYTTPIELLAITNTGETILYMLTPKNRGVDEGHLRHTNIRLLHFVNHFRELGYRLDRIVEYLIPFDNQSDDRVIQEDHVYYSELTHAANLFFSDNRDVYPNPAACAGCSANSTCVKNILNRRVAIP